MVISGGEVSTSSPNAGYVVHTLISCTHIPQNVSTLAVESIMSQHSDIGEVAVVARPHPKWGERPMAFIVLNQQAISKWKKEDLHKLDKEIKVFSRKSLAGYAVPEWIDFVDDLPKSR